MDLSALFTLSYGLYILGVPKEGGYSGCTVNTVFQVTSAGPNIAVSVSKENLTCGLMQQAGRFSVSVVSEETPARVISNFGFFSGRDRNKMEGVAYDVRDGLPFIREKCCAHLACEIIHEVDAYSHIVFFARVTDCAPAEPAPPMTYAYYRRVIKGKAPKNAPTYQLDKMPAKAPEKAPEKTPEKPAQTPEKAPEKPAPTYVCDVCGFTYTGDIAKEPADYACPVCGAGKSQFMPKG